MVLTRLKYVYTRLAATGLVLVAYGLFVAAGFAVHRAVGLGVAGVAVLAWDAYR